MYPMRYPSLIAILSADGQWCFDLLDPLMRAAVGATEDDATQDTAILAVRRFTGCGALKPVSSTALPRRILPDDPSSDLASALLRRARVANPTLRAASTPVVPEQTLVDAFSFIAEHAPATLDAMQQHHVGILETLEKDAISFSQADCYGVIFLSEAPDVSAASLAVTIVHEFAHQELFLINAVDPLVSEQGVTDVRFSPFQKKPRPVLGRLHAAHALFRMAEFIGQAGWPASVSTAGELSGVIDTLSPDLLTPFGADIVDMVYRPCIDRFRV